LKVQYIDGTKIESAAGRYTFVWKGSVEKNKAKLENKIQSVLWDIESQIRQDQSELGRGETPRPIKSDELRDRLSALNEKLKEAAKPTQKQLKKLREEHLPRLEKYEKQLATLGESNSYSKTVEDATFLRLKSEHMENEQRKPAYTPQLSTEERFITHYSIHQSAGDTTTLKDHLEGFDENYGSQSGVGVANAGYGSEQSYEKRESKKI